LPRIVDLQYSADSAHLFQTILDLPWAAFLDSGTVRSPMARYDVLTAAPYLTITTRGTTSEIRTRDSVEYSDRDPL
jgi:para-aminobenzoate synthetase component 1